MTTDKPVERKSNKSRSTEELIEEFDSKFRDYIKDISVGQYDENGVNIGYKKAKDLIKDYFTQAFQRVREERDKDKHAGHKLKVVIHREDDYRRYPCLHCSCSSTWSSSIRAMHYLVDRINSINTKEE